MIAPNCDRIECEERNNLKKANPVNFIVNFHSLCDVSRDCSHHFHRTRLCMGAMPKDFAKQKDL